MKTMPPRSGAATLEKGLVLLKRIARDRGACRLADLTDDLALSRSTLYRLCGVLQRHGLIARLGPDRYDISQAFLAVVASLSENEQLVRVSRPHLEMLARACGATAHIGVMDNDMVTYLVKACAGLAEAGVPFTREGAQLEAYGSGIGKVLLAWLPDAERRRYLAGGPFVRMTARTVTDPIALASLLDRVRAEALARDDGEVADHLYCLAVPLWTDRVRMTAAISVSFLHPDGAAIDETAAVRELRACAARISGMLAAI